VVTNENFHILIFMIILSYLSRRLYLFNLSSCYLNQLQPNQIGYYLSLKSFQSLTFFLYFLTLIILSFFLITKILAYSYYQKLAERRKIQFEL
jgi:hypothetical protein